MLTELKDFYKDFAKIKLRCWQLFVFTVVFKYELVIHVLQSGFTDLDIPLSSKYFGWLKEIPKS